MAQILIVEDNKICQGNIITILQNNYKLLIADSKQSCLSILQSNQIDLILLDITLPDSTDLQLLSSLVASTPDIPIIIFTEEDDPDIAAEVIKRGARDYALKNKCFANSLLLINKINAVLETVAYKAMSNAKSEQIDYLNRHTLIPKKYPEYRTAYIQAELAFKGKLSLLVTGETGSGKNRLIDSIHKQLLPDAPLIAIDCGTISSTLAESELFGHEKGAFTDAHQTKQGKVELANGGILLLDEINNASPAIQTKLL